MSVAPPRTRSTRDRQVSSGRSSRAWWWTALTGTALLLLLTVHMVAHHFVVEDVGGLRSYEQVLDYIANPVIFTLELFFLIVVTIHALLGLRGVLFDLGIGVRARRRTDLLLWLLGLVTVGYGCFLLGTLASRA
jgi:succinate dehydrogenase hydrophobic anchor subunit